MAELFQIVGSFTPLERNGEEWRGACIACDSELQVIGERWRCVCGAHDAGDDALAFLRLAGEPDPEGALSNGRLWEPTLTKPTPPPAKYGIQRALDHPDKTILITDSRKAAEVADRLLSAYVCCNWTDHGSRWDGLEPLRGRNLLLWPTQDVAALERLESVVCDPRGLACTGKILSAPINLTEWSGTGDELIAAARQGIRPLRIPQVADAAQPAVESAGKVASPVEVPTGAPDMAAQAPDDPPAEPITAMEKVMAEYGYTPIPNAPQSRQGDAEPPPVQDSDWPQGTQPRPPKRRRLKVVGGADIDQPDPDAEPVPHELSESGVAAHFVALHKDRFRTVHEWSGKQGACWMAWDGSRWKREPSRVTAMQQGQLLCASVKNWDGARSISELSKVKFESRKFIGAVLDLASYSETFVTHPDQFDADPYLLGTPAGTVDLRLGKLTEPDPEQYLTRQTSVAPAAGPHPLFDDVIRRASGGEQDMAAYLWRWLGLLCTGDVSQEVFLYAVGKPQSGKTTLVSAIADILGDVGDGGYAAHCDIEMFTESKLDKGNDRLAHLAGARFAYASEMEEGRNFKTALLKMATGGDKLSGRFLYAEKFSFTATHKLWITGNHMLHLKSSDAGLKRRLHLLEYQDAFIVTDEERDNTFKERLKLEYPAILHSMIKAVQQYLECGGLGRPERISQAVEEYTTNEDTLAQWIEECLTIEPGSKTQASEAYESFRKWAEKEGAFAPSAKRFSQQLTERGYTRTRSAGTRYFVGFRVKMGSSLP